MCFIGGSIRLAARKMTELRIKAPALLLLAGSLLGGAAEAVANPVRDENSKLGNERSEWDISNPRNTNILGFATDISFLPGENVDFKIKTNSKNYRIDVYRLGYYAGKGARKIGDTVVVKLATAQAQPSPLKNTATGLVDAGNWAKSASWTVPPDAVSGVYVAKLVRQDGTAGNQHIPFVVRSADTAKSDILFQTSDTTWQAYNTWGGNSLYRGSPAGRAYKVSYNRPFTNRGDTTGTTGPRDFLFDADYPMLRWLERNGYDVSYVSGVDMDRRGGTLRAKDTAGPLHRIFVSVGHDEYWSGTQWAHVVAARNAGVNLAFFSGNEVFWKTRWENSLDVAKTPYRTLVCYKETHAGGKIDPSPLWTGTWRDPRFSPPSDGGRPENQLTGTIFTVNDGSVDDIVVPPSYGDLRFWRHTNIGSGEEPTLSARALTYEWDEDLDNGVRPPGLIRLSSTEDNQVQYLQDYGSTFGAGTATHTLTLYRQPGGGLVFGAGTPRWAWGLDDVHDVDPATPMSQQPQADLRMQQATLNLFADMGVQPETPQPGLVPTAASTDTAAPTATILEPASGATVGVGTTVTIRGTAGDTNGVVGGVEISTDGGARWHPATGRGNWTYAWRPLVAQPVQLQARAIDDSLNIQQAPSTVAVTVASGGGGGGGGGQGDESSLFGEAIPAVSADPDTAAVELGVKFRPKFDGFVTGLRFYKDSQNTGTHVGTLWSGGGQQLASATFVETASGWQEVYFASPVPVTAGALYVASYHTNVGRYSVDVGFFQSGVDTPALYAPADGEAGGNGVYKYSGSTAFPNETWQSSNYWVDVLFKQ